MARTVPVTMAGRTHEVPVDPPEMPVDWRHRALIAALVVTGVLTAACVVWSTVSIGRLLGGHMGYVGASVFDAAWLVVVVLEVYHRYDQERRQIAQWIGWGLLVVSMAALAGYGAKVGDLGVAIGGPAVSLVAKSLWVAVLGAVHRELSPVAARWVAAERDRAYAVADVDREVTMARARAAQLREALAARYGPLDLDVPVESAVVLERVEAEPGSAGLLGRAAADHARAEASLEAAANAGHPVREVLEQAARLRAEGSGTPPRAASTQVREPEPVPVLRPENPEPPGDGEDERVPQQRPPALRHAVRTLYTLGMTDTDSITRHLSGVLGEVARSSVDRYVREARAEAAATAAESAPGTGMYA
ncbi:hypothetical protein ACFYN3_40605 [Streptomyces lavendulae]|uniref:hypothetical protein n=1 Tax=Streptomyces lavendulae TaxID=1914 RepID=UPI0036BDA1B7